MDAIGHEEPEKIEPGELLEDGWFFGNLLDRKPRMLRSVSDLCTSSKSYEETYASIKKSPDLGKQIRLSNMMTRAPSEGSGLERQVRNLARKPGKSSNRKTPSKGLHRAPSLPATLQQESEDFRDEEVEFSMGKLIRQASMNNRDGLPPRQQPGVNKVMAPNSANRWQRKYDPESTRLEGLEDMKPNPHKLKTQKSFTQYEELRGFENLGLETCPVAVNNETSTRRPNLPEGRKGQSSAPPMPKLGGNGNGIGKKSSEDMKAQIRFWARAVASNVRQEC